MAETVALSKILNVRENEKQNAQKAYQAAVESFEETATQLYNLLVRKEEAEKTYDASFNKPNPINKIREQAAYLESLNKQINYLQMDVQRARTEMETKHKSLNAAYVEVKKFEKIIEHREFERKRLIKKNEEITMDEVSMQQFLGRRIR